MHSYACHIGFAEFKYSPRPQFYAKPYMPRDGGVDVWIFAPPLPPFPLLPIPPSSPIQFVLRSKHLRGIVSKISYSKTEANVVMAVADPKNPVWQQGTRCKSVSQARKLWQDCTLPLACSHICAWQIHSPRKTDKLHSTLSMLSHRRMAHLLSQEEG